MLGKLKRRKKGDKGQPDPSPKAHDPKVAKRRRRNKVLMVLASVSFVIGLVLHFTAPPAQFAVGDSTQSTLTREGITPNSLVGTGVQSSPDGEPITPAAESGIHSWSPLFMKGGLSFLIGFSIGYALRTFLKLSMLVTGVVALAVFGLSYAGLVEVDWDTISGIFDKGVAKVREEAGQFKTFITGSLPSASIAAAGLVLGFRR